ncbi:MAG: BspA family leucine-rich repeat surface protein, partial [Lachnospiraceae bacterium]|nr:BspA family leucine-rich repeat surface protein [Lachnospiraceae bacterium]
EWEAAFTIHFDPNGGEGQMEEVYLREGESGRYLPSCTFFREGHKFTGWNTKADGTGNSYSDSSYLYWYAYDYDEDITLYAQWRQAGGPQVICSKSGDGKYTLSFVNSPIDYFEESEYNGESILQVWTGTKVTNSGEGENYNYYQYGKNEPAWVNSGYLFNRFVIDESFINVLPISTAYWFIGDPWGNSPNQEIIGLEYLNTSETTDMSGMFYRCGVSELDLRSLITTKVTNMSWMFCGCQASSLDLSTFDTSNVTDMRGMFVSCGASSLDLSAFDTSNVLDMSRMFSNCRNLTSLNLGMLNTSNVTNMSEMFASCSKLTSLDLSMLNTSNVTNMSWMFGGCIGLNSLTLKGIDTSNVTDMSYMFGTYMDPGIANTSMKIKELDLSDLDTSSVTNMSGLFSGCNELTSLDLSHFNTSQVQTMEKMFYSCLRLETLDLSSFDMRNVTNADAMFGECKRLKTIFCMDGESAWPDDSYSQYSQGILFGSNTNLVGRYGTTEVPFNAGYADAEMARSAKLGGYFTPKYVTVGFDANGGTGELEGFRTYSGFYDAEGIVLPGNVFAKECGLFAGWNTRADGSGDFYEDCSAFAPLEDVILYAQWDDDHDWEEAAYVWANDYKTVTATRVCGKNNDHQFTETVSVTKTVVEPTCESEGYTLLTASFESDLFETQTKKVDEKPASGHRYGEAFYHWAYDNTHVIAMLICEIDNTHVLTEVAEVTATIVEPTCESEGYTLLKAVFENEAFEPQTRIIDNVPPHGHQYGAPTYQWTDDNSLVIARAACGFDNAHVLMEISETSLVIKANDCENSGERIYTASFENEIFETQTKVIVMPALGHKPGEPVKENEKAATCTEEGSYDELVYCTVCGEELSRTHETVAALGHDWSEAVWTWSEDYTEASATFTCGHDCTHVETVEAEVTRETDEENGLIIYTATVVFEGKTYTDTKEQEIPKEPWTWTRLSGSNRYATMASINQAAFADGSMRTLIVATGESFPDALSGASLSGIYGCPIILTKSDALRKETKAEIERLASPEGCRVIILGGTGAVSQTVEDAIIAMGYSVERVAGTNRVKTAIEVYRKGVSEDAAFAANDTVIISTGYNYADVLSISPYAYASKTPILLTNQKGELSAEVKSLIKEAGFRKAIIVGGIGAVAESTEDYLKMQGLSVLRLAGKTRYATSGTIMKWEIGLLSDEAIQPAVIMTNAGMGVASGENFPDALASVSLLGQSRSVLMLVSNTKSRATIQDNINELIKPYAREMKKGYIFGGTGAVSEEIEQLLNESIE